MPRRKIILIILALMIATGTTMVVRSMMVPAAKVAEPTTTPKLQEVIVAARDLPVGTLLKETDLKWQTWPAEGVVEGFAVKDRDSLGAYTGSVVRQSMRLGDPVLASRVVRTRDQGFMAAVLNPGMRAFTVAVTPTSGVGGFVFPGDRVDVILAHRISRKTDLESAGHKVSETVVTNARVLALDQRADDQVMEPKLAQTATLEVTPKEAEILALVADLGVVSLALRSIIQEGEEKGASPPDSSSDKQAEQVSPKGGLTWDSDISRVLPSPGNRSGSVQRVQVMRGKEITEFNFDVRE